MKRHYSARGICRKQSIFCVVVGTSAVWLVFAFFMLLSINTQSKSAQDGHDGPFAKLDSEREAVEARRKLNIVPEEENAQEEKRHEVENLEEKREERQEREVQPGEEEVDDNRRRIAEEEDREAEMRRQQQEEMDAVAAREREREEAKRIEAEEEDRLHHEMLNQRNEERQNEEQENNGREREAKQVAQEEVANDHEDRQVELKREDGKSKEEEEKRLKEEGFARHAFNQLLSDRIGLEREIPDTRQQVCQNQDYPEDLPSASIVICFHNEALSALLRTAKTALSRGGPKHILEILLIDDASTFDELKEPLQGKSLEVSDKIRVVHLDSRQGLIRARVRGAKEAKGEVVVFLDSHCECNQDWLRPLLARIKEDRRHVVCPVIDIINTDTMDYQASPLVRGGFTWSLNFNWENIPFPPETSETEMIKPAKSPTMAGGLFAVHRQYFFDVGSYDMGMEVWGGENLEISFRIWMCGGRLEIIPCSRVGHIFRLRRPYDDAAGIDAMAKNGVRVAEVWMDDYKKLYYKERTFGSNEFGDITDRVNLRKQLKCKSFQWFLDNIYPEKSIPDDFKKEMMEKNRQENLQRIHDNPNDAQAREALDGVMGQGQLRNVKSQLCLSGSLRGKFHHKIYVSPCAGSSQVQNQMWSLSQKNELILSELCLDAAKGLRLKKCDLSEDQTWNFSFEKRVLFHPKKAKCLQVNGYHLVLSSCRKDSNQHWEITEPQST